MPSAASTQSLATRETINRASPPSSVAGISTLTSVKSSAPLSTTAKNPTEKPKPSSRRRSPSLSVPVAISVLNNAPAVMSPPAIVLRSSTSGHDRPAARWAPTWAISEMTFSGARN